jgi:hypothetical protein
VATARSPPSGSWRRGCWPPCICHPAVCRITHSVSWLCRSAARTVTLTTAAALGYRPGGSRETRCGRNAMMDIRASLLDHRGAQDEHRSEKVESLQISPRFGTQARWRQSPKHAFAKFDKGVLTLTVPKRRLCDPRVIRSILASVGAATCACEVNK